MKKYSSKKRYPFGGEAMAANPMLSLATQAPAVLDSIMSIFESSPNAYSKQPTLNANTMRGMVTPYSFAFGGSIEDLGIDEATLQQLQAMAEEQGISLEELIQNLSSGDDSIDVPEQEQEMELETPEDAQVTDEGVDLPSDYAYGGRARKVDIEVEGNEIMQLPSGGLKKVKGPSHAKGGVDVKVPVGTKIYSNRLSRDGKTMQERKLARANRLAKASKLLDTNPNDPITKNTVARIAKLNTAEEAEDMQIQEAANKIYNYGREKAAYGNPGVGLGGPEPRKFIWQDFFGPNYDPTMEKDLDPVTFKQKVAGVPPYAGSIPNTVGPNPGSVSTNAFVDGTIDTMSPLGNVSNIANTISNPARTGANITPGDAVGLAGSAFGIVAPLLNTLDAAGNSRPNVNRFKSFGQDALNTNQSAIDIAAKDKVGVMADIDTSTQSSYLRNRNSARSVNTLRALDNLSDMTMNKARNAAENDFTGQKLGLLGQRSQLQNVADLHRMRGEQMRDMEDKADLDNVYTNLAQNYAGISEGIQGIGRNLNISHDNQVNATLISQLSKYGLKFDKDGNLISSK
jgi:hypothetical protein